MRLLGFVFLVIICVQTAPWGLAIGSILVVAWLFVTPASLTKSADAGFFEKAPRFPSAGHRPVSAIPLVHAAYCANCDSISDSPHDTCRICGSHSVIAVARLWQLRVAHAPAHSAKFKLNFTADVREIPAVGLSEAIHLIARLAELGGDMKVFHIQVDSLEPGKALAERQKMELVKAPPRPATAWPSVHRQAS